MAQTVATTPLVSVIMPAYNAADYINEAVASALGQSYTNIELIIVNDGSTDGTAAILGKLNDARVHVTTTANQGVSVARNTAMARAKGEWLAFLDADDVWNLDKLQLQSQYFADFDLICSNAIVLSGPRAGALLLAKSHLEGMNSRGILQLVEGSHPPMSSVCLRRSALGQEQFTAGQRFGEDFALWLRLVAGGARLRAIPDPLYSYRVHEGNATAQTPDAALQAATILADFAQGDELSTGVAAAARESARHNYYQHCKQLLADQHYSMATAWELARNAQHYGASFVKVLLFAIIRTA